MLIRIVRMTFQDSRVDEFLTLFNEVKDKIRHYNGCKHLTLLRDAHQSSVFMTYSIWESEEALESYRNSELFKVTWKRTKQWFSEKPIAYSAYEEIKV